MNQIIRFVSNHIEKVTNTVAFIFVICGCLYLISDNANAHVIKKQQDDIDALLRIANACLSDSTGRHVSIGSKHYLCGIVEIGEFK